MGCSSHLASKDLNVARRGSAGECSWGDQGKLRQQDTSHVQALLQHHVEGLYPSQTLFYEGSNKGLEVMSLAESHMAEWWLDAELSRSPRQYILGNRDHGTCRPQDHADCVPSSLSEGDSKYYIPGSSQNCCFP